MIDDTLFTTIMNRASQITSNAEKRGSLNAAIGYMSMQSALIERHAAELCQACDDFLAIANSTVSGATRLDAYNEMADRLRAVVSLTLQQIEINRAGEK